MRWVGDGKDKFWEIKFINKFYGINNIFNYIYF